MARGGSGVPVAVLVLIVGAAVALRWQAVGQRESPPAGGAVLATAGEAHGVMGGARR
jgi:hypothetical protein